MKLFVSLLFSLLLLCGLGTTALAAGDSPPEETVAGTTTVPEDAVLVEHTTGRPPAVFTGEAIVPQPIEVRYETLGEVPYITRTYEIAQDGNAAASLAALDAQVGFTQDCYRFLRWDSYGRSLPGSSESRTESITQDLPLEKDDRAAVLAMAAPVIDYCENGYVGQLHLDVDSIYIEEAGRESYGYIVADTREYTGLDRQDAAYIPKTVIKNGLTLQLENAEWTVMGATPTDEGLVPNLFKAVATYSGTANGSRASGYTATFRYTGTVEKTAPGSILVSIVYRGQLVPQPEPEGAPLLLILACVLGGMVVLALGAAVFITKGKRAGKTDVDKLKKVVEKQYDRGVPEIAGSMEDDDDEE